ncbi:MAG: signal peptidase II [Firmicutes bacterium]|nr:signal peptidase II [Bacillota bacterium]
MSKFKNNVRVVSTNVLAFVKKYYIEIIVFSAVIFVDLLTKYLVNSHIYYRDSVVVIPSVLSLTNVRNTGAAFSFLADVGWGQLFFRIVTPIALSFFGFLLYIWWGKGRFFRLSLFILIAGALGNFYDRLRFSYVRDMIQLDFIDFPIFNIADIALNVGVFMFIFFMLFLDKEPEKEDDKQASTAQTEESQSQSKDSQPTDLNRDVLGE